MDEKVVKDLIDRLIDLSFAEDIQHSHVSLLMQWVSQNFLSRKKVSWQVLK